MIGAWRQSSLTIPFLNPEATRQQVAKLCREAAEYGFYSVMVNPSNIAQCKAELRGTGVVTGTVIGFPLGATTSTSKLAEAGDALRLGATELDMVINVGALKSGDRDLVQMEMQSLVTSLPSLRSAAQGHHRNRAFDHRRKNSGLPTGRRGGSGFCENLHRLFQRRGHGCRCFADPRRGRP